MKTYTINESMGNFSEVVATFNNEDNAAEWLNDRIVETVQDLLGEEELNNTELYETEYQNQISYFNIETVETDLYTQIVEDGESKAYGEDIIDTFYNGNFSQGVEQLKEINATAIEFGDYIQELSEELGYESMSEFANNHFNYDFFICLGKESL